MENIFRSFFGFPKRFDPHQWEDLEEESHDMPTFCEDGCCLNDEIDEDDSPGDNHSPDFHFHFDFSNHVDDMFQHFEELFRNFGMAEYPPSGHFESIPGAERNGSLRDKMLKRSKEPDPDINTDSSQREEKLFFPEQPSFFGSLWKTPTWKKILPSEKVDKDCDGELSKEDLDKIASDSMETKPAAPIKQFQSFSKVTSVRTIRRPDGSTEHIKKHKKSDGSEETTVIRSVDGQSHRVTTKRDKDGHEETVETFKNMDEKSLPNFNQLWSNSSEKHQEPSSSVMLIPEFRDEDKETKSIFRNLFGLRLPRFGDL